MNSTQDFIDEVKGCLRENVIVGGDGSIDLSPLYNQIDSVNQSLREHSNNDDAHTSISEAAAIFSNPNLLINPDFSINQRGQTEYTESGKYTVDRWALVKHSDCTEASKVTYEPDGLTLNLVDGNWLRIYEMLESPLTKTFTVTVNIASATPGIRFDILGSDKGVETNLKATLLSGDAEQITVTYTPASVEYLQLNVRKDAGYGSVKIESVKLELGSVATPFVKPNPAVEMTKCQWFLEVIPLSTMLRAYHANGVEGFSLASPKRVVPTVTVYSADGEEGYLDEPLTSSKVKITGAQASTGAVVNILSDGAFTVHGVYRGKFVISAEL